MQSPHLAALSAEFGAEFTEPPALHFVDRIA
jgi:hypothetical protein